MESKNITLIFKGTVFSSHVFLVTVGGANQARPVTPQLARWDSDHVTTAPLPFTSAQGPALDN